MRDKHLLLKLIAAFLAVASIACIIISYSDKIAEFFDKLAALGREKRQADEEEKYYDPEFEDFADV